MSVDLMRRLFTVEEYHKMAQAGILTEDERVELIEGEILEMSPIGRRHAAHVKRLNKLFNQRLGDRVLVGVQDPVILSDLCEPEPDLSLLQPRPDFYEAGHPQPQDVFLLVEVADSTVETDQYVKVPTYAKSDIVEVWLVNITQQCLEVYRQPSRDGYQNEQKYQRGQTVSMQAFPDVTITVNEVLG